MSCETITSLSSTIVKTTEEAVKLMKTNEEILSQINLVKEHAENLLKLEGNLALLIYYLTKLQYLLHASGKVGGVLKDNTEKKQRSRHLINSCFKGRVCTGLIANLSIKDPLCFLNKAFNNFQRKIKTHRQKRRIWDLGYVMNILTFNSTGNIISLADDTAVLYSADTWMELKEKAEYDLGSLLDCFKQKKLSINYEKTCYLPFTCLASSLPSYTSLNIYSGSENIVLEASDHVKYLGISIDCHMRWDLHSNQYIECSQSYTSAPTLWLALVVNVVLVCNFIKPQSGDTDKKAFATKNHTIDINTNLKTWYRDNVIHVLASKLEEFSEKDSGWTLLEVLHLKVNINNFSRLKGVTSTYVSLPDFISRKRAVINKKKNVLPLSLSDYRNSNREPINLLVLSTENSNNNNSSPEFSNERTLFHFAWIKKMSDLLSKQLSSHGILESFETLGADNGKTVNYQKHTAFSVAYYLKCSYDDSLSRFKLYRSRDCINWFISELQDIGLNVNSLLKNSKGMETLSFEQEINYVTATHCHICNKPFISSDIKVRDHCHLTSKYRCAAHQDCNLNYQNSFNIPVVFHNLSGYDSNFIMKQLQQVLQVQFGYCRTEVLLRFIDSYRFMSSSLDKLSSYLEDEKKTIVRAYCNTDKEFNFLTRNRVFPYDYIYSWEIFTETCLPSKTNL
ncbi:hypothetical protein NQ315_000466 [Exocentrus adspersus]|uniref:DNA-directed DNA polymerase n=1 Tax=Exocentrus adspersus TaxID=1586481 RepID=A0AAV8VEU9_9CUCU|nr:hypothetical protein NQ315_000466 [Exocentrus adspersus]